MHERLVRISRLQRLKRIVLASGLAIAGGKNAARHRNEMWREQHRRFQRHFHFSRMTMIEQGVGREASVDGAEAGRLLRLAARAADSRGGIDDQALRIDETTVHQRLQRDDRSCGVAAGGGHRFRATDRRAVQLRDAVDELAQQRRSLVLMAVPTLIGCASSSRKSAPRSTNGMPRSRIAGAIAWL